MKHWKRHRKFCIARAASVLAGLAGVLVFVGADGISDNGLMALQILGGVAMVAAGAGLYTGFKYMELYLLEKERKLKRALQDGNLVNKRSAKHSS